MSSSEDEDIDRLKEAIATDFISDDLYQNGLAKTTTAVPKLPSLRRKDDYCDSQYENLGVTKEFQQFVAKHLVVMLDEKLKKQIDFSPKEYKTRKRKGGIKLFSKSDSCIKKIKEEYLPVKTKKIIEVNDDIEEEKFKSVAVDPDYIISKKETLNWSKRSRAKVFHYKSNKNGILQEIE